MKRNQTEFHIVRNIEEFDPNSRSGVSLHCHSMYSKEMLDFLPFYAKKLPWISDMYQKEEEKYFARTGHGIRFDTAHWSPPLTPQRVYDHEKSQLNNAGLAAIVSITDHDEICGNFEINDSAGSVPISLEWTVPYDYGFFHLGIHNLPRDRAEEIKCLLLDYTFHSADLPATTLTELFVLLNDLDDVLIVFNHPIWDIELVGEERHAALLRNFLAEYSSYIHALEINGFRNWSENQGVIVLAEGLSMPVVSGGDRHGCQANTVINLTDASEFKGFADEVRLDRRSSVAILPAYKQPLLSRQLQSFSEILGNYPDFDENRRMWFDRVFFDIDDGRGVVSLSDHGWKRGGPTWLRFAISVLGFCGSSTMRPMFQLMQKRRDSLPSSMKATERASTIGQRPLLEKLANTFGL